MRIVITGGPSVGKTTIITGLAERGYQVVNEFATQIIKEGEFLPWVDRASFQQEVLRRQLEAELALEGYEKTVFLDRGLFDGEAYYLYDELAVPEIFHDLDSSHYSLALLIEELPFFDVTDVRRENLEFTREISKVLERCYLDRGVHVIRIPAMPPQERIEYVLEEVRRFELAGRDADRKDDLPAFGVLSELKELTSLSFATAAESIVPA